MENIRTEPSRELIQAIYLGAASLLDSPERRAYLQSACGDNQQLRAAVEDMLAAESDAELFFAKGRQAVGQLVVTEAEAIDPGTPALDEDLEIETGRFKVL